MNPNVTDLRIVSDGRGAVVGYVFQRPGHPMWGAVLEGYCSHCSPEKSLGCFSSFAAAVAAIAANLMTGLRQ
jgi:hypothetical protein